MVTLQSKKPRHREVIVHKVFHPVGSRARIRIQVVGFQGPYSYWHAARSLKVVVFLWLHTRAHMHTTRILGCHDLGVVVSPGLLRLGHFLVR